MQNIDFLPHLGANTYDVLRHPTLFITLRGLPSSRTFPHHSVLRFGCVGAEADERARGTLACLCMLDTCVTINSDEFRSLASTSDFRMTTPSVANPSRRQSS